MSKRNLLITLIGLLVVGGVSATLVYYKIYNKPHRNIQRMQADFELQADQLFEELSTDLSRANEKYFNADILSVSGVLSSKKETPNSLILELRGNEDILINITLHSDYIEDEALREDFNRLESGNVVTVKGVYTGGDEDFLPGSYIAKLNNAYLVK